MRGNFTLYSILLLTLMFGGCRTWFNYVDGQTAYISKQYAVAANLLENDYNKTTNPLERSEIAYKIGESYRLSNQPKQAASWYYIAMEYALDPTVSLKYGLMLMQTEQYEEAFKIFDIYARNNPLDRSRATRLINSCKLATEWQNETSPYEISTLDSINTVYSDYAPVLLGKNYLVFSSARKLAEETENYGWTGEGFSNIYKAKFKKQKNRFEAPKKMEETINTPFNEGTACFTNDYNTIFFTRCVDDNFTQNFCQIYTANKTDGFWGEAERLVLFTDSVNVGQPCLSPNGKRLYFSSDALEGYGEKDIYVSQLDEDNIWSYPQNLGPEINTDGYEGFPYIHKNGDLYFASNGHIGMGGLDVFVAKPADKSGLSFERVNNLKSPINSGADDFALIFDKQAKPQPTKKFLGRGYFSSARKGGFGSDDIYSFDLLEIEEPPVVIEEKPKTIIEKPKQTVFIVDGTVFTKTYLNEDDPASVTDNNTTAAKVSVQISSENSKVNFNERLITNKDGKFVKELPSNSDYRITASLPNYFKESLTISTKQKTDLDTLVATVTLVLDKIFTNKEVTIDNIYYDLNKWDIRTDAAVVLDELAILLFENPTIKIEIGAHTDSRGEDKYNLELSSKRANAVIQYLNSKGIAADRLSSKGYGESQLINNCEDGIECAEEAHQQNRRTTFKVVG